MPRTQKHPPANLPRLLRAGEVAKVLRISRALAYKWMKTGVLPALRHARYTRVPEDGALDHPTHVQTGCVRRIWKA
jgi:predicted DNA-binding transcriptional regulator AlpA